MSMQGNKKSCVAATGSSFTFPSSDTGYFRICANYILILITHSNY